MTETHNDSPVVFGRANMTETHNDSPVVFGPEGSDDDETALKPRTSQHEQLAKPSIPWLPLSVGVNLGLLVSFFVMLLAFRQIPAKIDHLVQISSSSNGSSMLSSNMVSSGNSKRVPAGQGRGGPRWARNVYIDLGANWADTLDLYQRIADSDHNSLANWEVYAFEISPHLISYVDRYVRYKNGFDKRPRACVLPISASADVPKFAPALNCALPNLTETRHCISKTLRKATLGFLQNAHPNMISLSAVNRKLDIGAYPLERNATQPRYTFVPAGVGHSSGTLTFGSDKKRTQTAELDESSIGHIAGLIGLRKEEPVTVQIIDYVKWIGEHFTKDDYIVMKIDIEGSEFQLFDKLRKKGLMGLFDVVALECHPWSGNCKKLDQQVRSGVGKLIYEGKDYHSRANMDEAVEQFRQDWLSHECERFRT